VLEKTLNAMMKHERSVEEVEGNKANGYRTGKVYGHGKLRGTNPEGIKPE
jgi:hypothetical protein